MSIRSLYFSGDDKEELFRLTAPEEPPDSGDESTAILEEQSISGNKYDDEQDAFDQAAESTPLSASLETLSDDELAEVARLIAEIQSRREEG